MLTITAAFELAREHYRLGRLQDAEMRCRDILEVQPEHPHALRLLGMVAFRVGKHQVAVDLLRRTLACDSYQPAHYNDLGAILSAQGSMKAAKDALQSALRLNPGFAEAHYNLADVLSEQGEADAAIAAYRSALRFKPHYPGALNNLANALVDTGRLDEALDCYRRALTLDPEAVIPRSNLIYTLEFDPSCDATTLLQEKKLWNSLHCQSQRSLLRPHANNHDSDRKLRIGYVSPNFRKHVVAQNLLPLLRNHDHQQFEIICYSGVAQADEVTAKCRESADHWQDTILLNNGGLASAIRRDSVDILVDLALYMFGNRLPVFARKPAPVQVSFAGYPGSTGVETIDYRLTDRYLEPPSLLSASEGEEPVYLAHSFWCYEPDGTEPEGNSLPAMERGYVTFGCLNNFCKVNEPMLALWARVLEEAKGARLMILAKEGSHRQRTVDSLARHGVSSERVEFVGFRPRREYLECYHQVDIALDTFPYNGHTTSLDALWMGVPVVSLSGETPVSRAGLSQLSNIGMPELVTPSRDDYVHIAVALAHDRSRLAALRATLRTRMQASPLTDAPGFARTVEDAYRLMWGRWCAAQRNR